MKVLIISQKKILPMNDGAKVYSLGLIRFLKENGAEVTLISFYEYEDYSEEEKATLMCYVKGIYSCKLKWQNTGLNLSFIYPNSIRKYTRQSMRNLIKKVCSCNSFDEIIIDHTQMYEYAKLFSTEKIVLYTHNVESDIWFDYAKRSKGITQKLVLRSANMYKKYEAAALSDADVVTAISQVDADRYVELCPNVNPIVFNGYNKFLIVKTGDDIKSVNNSILFIGSYGWHPNSIAADYLIDRLMPILRTKRKNITLYLVGKNPTNKMKEAGRNFRDIIVTGLVESVDPYISKCDIFVNAVVDGSGINIKMIEAMGKGIPIVSSEFGARGILIKDGKDVLIYKNAEDCATRILELIDDREKAALISCNARKYYEDFIMPSKEFLKNILEP